ncbi:hypothetical protein [Rhizobium herbae]
MPNTSPRLTDMMGRSGELCGLFRSGDKFGVLPADEIDGDEVEIMYEYDPYEGRPAH